ncbi:MAG: hypothetical protein ABH873_08400 [Candidatus Firestonebacteria bacterium]
MRTTVVLEPEIEKLVKVLSDKKEFSQFINQCIREHFKNEEKKKIKNKLAVSYRMANKEGEEIVKGFKSIEVEGWPKW